MINWKQNGSNYVTDWEEGNESEFDRQLALSEV
jgi:hypothetical protein